MPPGPGYGQPMPPGPGYGSRCRRDRATGSPCRRRATAGQPPMRPDEEKLWAIAAHLGPLVVGVIAPLVVWLVFKDRSAFLDRTGKEALEHAALVPDLLRRRRRLTIIVLVGLILLPAVGAGLAGADDRRHDQGRERRGLPLPGDHPLHQGSRSRTTASASSRPRGVSTTRP